MNRITSAIANSRQKLLIPFFTAGYPDLVVTGELVQSAADAGADIVELGMPFSDPLADGPEIQYSSKAALDRGTTMHDTLHLVANIRTRSQIPIVLMGYLNPLLAYGLKKFCRDAGRAGVDGLIIPDLPADEAGEYCQIVQGAGLSTIFLVSPTSEKSRISLIDACSSDFVYAVSVTGVTGAGKQFDHHTDRYLKGLSRQLTKPFVVGFGVSGPADAVRLASHGRGIVIGSALVRAIRGRASHAQAVRDVSALLRLIRRAI